MAARCARSVTRVPSGSMAMNSGASAARRSVKPAGEWYVRNPDRRTSVKMAALH